MNIKYKLLYIKGHLLLSPNVNINKTFYSSVLVIIQKGFSRTSNISTLPTFIIYRDTILKHLPIN